jgi:hypothetical protein
MWQRQLAAALGLAMCLFLTQGIGGSCVLCTSLFEGMQSQEPVNIH